MGHSWKNRENFQRTVGTENVPRLADLRVINSLYNETSHSLKPVLSRKLDPKNSIGQNWFGHKNTFQMLYEANLVTNEECVKIRGLKTVNQKM